MIRRFQQAMLLVIALLSGSSRAWAADLYQNQTAGINTFAFANVAGSNRAGITFGVGATGYQLTSFTFVPVTSGTVTLQQMTISLYLYNNLSDLNASPIVSESGSELFNPLSTATPSNKRTFSPSDPTLWKLDANKTYVLMASAPATTNIGFALSNPFNNLPTMGGGVSYLGAVGTTNSGTTWNSTTAFNMWGTITADAVPEPSTYALGVIATGVMAAVARRRKARA